MIKLANENWIADLWSMTCWNSITKIMFSFEKKGNSLTGKIKEIPLEVMENMVADPHGRKNIKKMIIEAKNAFLQAYFDYTARCDA